MILKIILYTFLATFVLGVIIFIREIKKASLVDDNEPFLWDDYVPNEK